MNLQTGRNKSTESMSTVTEVIEKLRAEGYDLDLEPGKAGLEADGVQVPLNEVVIDKVYRFEGDTNPSDSAAVYAISSKTSEKKGVLVAAYGAYSDPELVNILKKLPKEKHV